jgi:hypothetical protein
VTRRSPGMIPGGFGGAKAPKKPFGRARRSGLRLGLHERFNRAVEPIVLSVANPLTNLPDGNGC